MLASRMCGFLANFCERNFTVPSVGREYSQLSSPSANMFLVREASLRLSSNSSTAPVASPVRSSACTW